MLSMSPSVKGAANNNLDAHARVGLQVITNSWEGGLLRDRFCQIVGLE